jgi:hypothetical protein
MKESVSFKEFISLNESDVFKRWAQENKERKQKEREDSKQREAQRKERLKQSVKLEKERNEKSAFYKIERHIGDVFPDGDPTDEVEQILHEYHLSMRDLNRIFIKFAGVKYDQYLANMWKDVARYHISLANTRIAHGKKPESSPFYDWQEGQKKVTPVKNPRT